MKTIREIRIEVAGYEDHLTKDEVEQIAKAYALQVAEAYRDSILNNLPRTSNNDMLKYRAKVGIYILNKDLNNFIQ